MRLGHARGLIVHRTIIQYPRAASLPLPYVATVILVRLSKCHNKSNNQKKSSNYINNAKGYQISFFLVRPSIVSYIHFFVSVLAYPNHTLRYAMRTLPAEFHTQEAINSASGKAKRRYYHTYFAHQKRYKRNKLKCFPKICPKQNFPLFFTAHIFSRSAAQPS